jgi:hypothetical protein
MCRDGRDVHAAQSAHATGRNTSVVIATPPALAAEAAACPGREPLAKIDASLSLSSGLTSFQSFSSS